MDAFDDENELSENFDSLLLESDDEFDQMVQNEVEGEEDVPVVPVDEEEEDSETEKDTEGEDEDENSWDSEVQAHDRWVFREECGFHDDVFMCYEPIDFYRLFVNEQLIDIVVTETNRYGKKKEDNWMDTNADEIKKFIGLCLQMGLVRLPKLRDYWSTRTGLGGHAVAGSVMSRKRFETLLTCLHFADNDGADKTSRLYKIHPILEELNKSFRKMYRPGKDLCIDESLVPFRGRVRFRQYIPSKRHRYDIKLFKICSNGGYTSSIKVYARKEKPRSGSVADSVIMELMEGYLDQGRDLWTDNWYTSLPLAKALLKRKTNLIGTLRKNRRGVPPMIKGTKLKRGESCSKQNQNGIMILKWKDKRDIYMLSTKHDSSCSGKNKPTVVEEYNSMKGFVDLSDQMASYTPFVRKTTKWYIRLFFHLLTQTAVINSWMLYCKTRMTKIKLNDYKLEFVESFLRCEEPYMNTPTHRLEELGESKANDRRRCVSCYKEMCKVQGRVYAASHAKRVRTRCSKCKHYFCIDCFQSSHKNVFNDRYLHLY